MLSRCSADTRSPPGSGGCTNSAVAAHSSLVARSTSRWIGSTLSAGSTLPVSVCSGGSTWVMVPTCGGQEGADCTPGLTTSGTAEPAGGTAAGAVGGAQGRLTGGATRAAWVGGAAVSCGAI